MVYEVGDIVKLKKPHPCGSHEWEILRVGAFEMCRLRASGDDGTTIGRKEYQRTEKSGREVRIRAAGGRTDAGSFMIWQSVKECSKKGQKARKKRENLHRKSRKSACQAVSFLVS